MRWKQKEIILDIVYNLHQAHHEIRDALITCNMLFTQDMLAECQDTAVQVGNFIEENEGITAVTIPYIMEYCETLYECSESLKNGDTRGEIFQILEMILKKVEYSINHDIQGKIEVAFFPYKASMWDSLDSIYMEAKSDVCCDAYVVPIPYYEITSVRTPGALQFDGDKYPSDIPIVDYQTYHFEERRPDIIYFHNPYDGCNLVTSVLPRFYSSNLKKFTDMLVYIPYFICEEVGVENQIAIDSFKHLFILPGVIHADKVIVQSENIRKIYINEFMKFAEMANVSIDRKQLENKIVGLGSPKLDKVLIMKKEDYEIPEHWMNKLKKEDGKWKKIIFYNTSVASVLNNTNLVLEKIRNVLDSYRHCTDEFVLLWRPHPLIEATLLSIREEYYEEFIQIKEKYIQGGWGIFDDTSDFDRAIAISDAYFGDVSSVITLYKKTRKPIMIQKC